MSKIPKDLRDDISRRMDDPTARNLFIHPSFAAEMQKEADEAFEQIKSDEKVVPFNNRSNDMFNKYTIRYGVKDKNGCTAWYGGFNDVPELKVEITSIKALTEARIVAREQDADDDEAYYRPFIEVCEDPKPEHRG